MTTCSRSWISYTLKMEAIRSSEMSINKLSTRRHIPGDGILQGTETSERHVVTLFLLLPAFASPECRIGQKDRSLMCPRYITSCGAVCGSGVASRSSQVAQLTAGHTARSQNGVVCIPILRTKSLHTL
jgi:hypothetical protein